MYPPPHMMHLSLLIPNSHPPPGYLPHSRPLPLALGLSRLCVTLLGCTCLFS